MFFLTLTPQGRLLTVGLAAVTLFLRRRLRARRLREGCSCGFLSLFVSFKPRGGNGNVNARLDPRM